jgi:hypothetical protein
MGKKSTQAPVWSAGVLDTARRNGDASNEGDPCGRRSRLQRRFWRRTGRESDRAIVLSKSGNSGGGKDPDFWRAFEDGEERVIGDEP